MKHLVCLLCLLLPIASQDVGSSGKRAGGGWWGDLLEERTVPLADVMERPDRWRGQSLSFVVQIQRIGRIDNPFHTRFEADEYTNYRCWSDDAPLWVRKAYEDVYRHLFVKRGSETERALEGAPEYSRWVVTGAVCEVVKGQPWIEATSARRLKTHLDEPALVHIVKGFMLRDLKRWDASASAFHAADGSSLPRRVRALIAREEAKALVRGGKKTLAVLRLRAAVRVVGEDKETMALLKRWGSRAGKASGRGGPRLTPPAPKGGAGGTDGTR